MSPLDYDIAEALLLLAAGACLGIRIEGGSVWVGLAGLLLLIVWLVVVASRSVGRRP